MALCERAVRKGGAGGESALGVGRIVGSDGEEEAADLEGGIGGRLIGVGRLFVVDAEDAERKRDGSGGVDKVALDGRAGAGEGEGVALAGLEAERWLAEDTDGGAGESFG